MFRYDRDFFSFVKGARMLLVVFDAATVQEVGKTRGKL